MKKYIVGRSKKDVAEDVAAVLIGLPLLIAGLYLIFVFIQ